jgi:hypothetical protein
MSMMRVAVLYILLEGIFVFPGYGKGFVNQWLGSNYGLGTFFGFFYSSS